MLSLLWTKVISRLPRAPIQLRTETIIWFSFPYCIAPVCWQPWLQSTRSQKLQQALFVNILSFIKVAVVVGSNVFPLLSSLSVFTDILCSSQSITLTSLTLTDPWSEKLLKRSQ